MCQRSQERNQKDEATGRLRSHQAFLGACRLSPEMRSEVRLPMSALVGPTPFLSLCARSFLVTYLFWHKQEWFCKINSVLCSQKAVKERKTALENREPPALHSTEQAACSTRSCLIAPLASLRPSHVVYLEGSKREDHTLSYREQLTPRANSKSHAVVC